MRTPDVISREKQRLASLICRLEAIKPAKSAKQDDILRKCKIRLRNLNFRSPAQSKAGWK
jgi:hypothetical protein